MRYVTRFDVGDAISTSIKTWAKLFLPLTAFGFLAALPVVMVAWLFPFGDLNESPPEDLVRRFTIVAVLAGIVGMVSTLVVSGAVTDLVFRHLNQEAVNAGRSLADGFAKLPRLLGLTLIMGLGATVIAVPISLAALAGPLGILLAIVMGLALVVVFLGLVLASPALVVENLSPMDAIRRSLFLAKGRRFGIFATIFVVGFVAGILAAIVKFFLPELQDPSAPLEQIASNLRRAMTVEALAGAPFSMIAAVSYVVIYYDLRVEKDGVAADDLAKVFG